LEQAMETRCVMFDCFNVLVHGNAQSFYDFIKLHRYSSSPDPEQFFHSELLDQYERGQIDDSTFFRKIRNAFSLDVSQDDFFSAQVFGIRPDEIMIRLKDTLKQNKIKLAVVSNINRFHFEHIQREWPEVFSGFDHLALSFRMGLRKPHPRMWQEVSECLWERSPKKCLFIDDQIQNTNAFERLGGIGYHYPVLDERFCPNGQLETERTKLIWTMLDMGLIDIPQASDLTNLTL
jgi:HAD superfamily hydrolase (TIGR01509 family)